MGVREESEAATTVDDGPTTSTELWRRACGATEQLAAELAENLRTVLEPTKLSRLQ